MTLREDLYETVYGLLHEENLYFLSTSDQAEYITETVWDMLEDKIGTVQEKLLNDLTLAREHLDIERRKVQNLSMLLAQPESQREAQ